MDAFIKKIIVTCTLFFFALTSLNAIENKLVLNGEGVRDKFFIDLYNASLYLKEKNSDAQKVVMADEQMSIKLHIVSSLIDSEKMENSTREGFQNSTNGNIEPISNKIELFISVFKEKIEENDIYEFKYAPKIGTQIYKNSMLKKTIVGLEFKKALFGIWLGDKPAQNSLKESLLGK